MVSPTMATVITVCCSIVAIYTDWRLRRVLQDIAEKLERIWEKLK